MEWAEHDAKGKPCGGTCLVCFDTVQKVMPNKTPEEIMLARDDKEPSQQALWEEFEASRQIQAGEVDRPDYFPKSDVVSNTSYSLQVYTKIGLVSEVDLLRLSGCTPKQLKDYMSGLAIKLDNPKSTKILYPISLRGLPADELVGMIKAKICHDISVTHAESMLRAEDQLSQNQGLTLFGLTAAGLADQRPTLKDPSKILSIDKLKEIKRNMDAAVAAKNAAEENDSSDEDGSGAESETANIVKGKGKGQPRRFNLGSLASSSSKKKKATPAVKAKVSGRAAGAKAVASGPKDARDESQDRGSLRSSTTKQGKQSKHDKAIDDALELLKNDEEMQRVAKKHLQTKRGSSVKCLQGMDVKEVLKGNKPGMSIAGVGCCKKKGDVLNG